MEPEQTASIQHEFYIHALIAASQDGHCDIVRLLLERGAEVNAVMQDGASALMYASQNGHCDTVRLLLEREAEVNTVTQSGMSALMLASQNGHCDTVRLLLEGEAEVNTVAQDGATALMLASQNGHSGTVRMLLEREAEFNAVTRGFQTALLLASQKGHYDIVRMLLQKEVEVNTVAQDGATALMYASQNGHSGTVRLLLEREAEVNTVAQDGATALIVASQNGHCDIVRLLLEREADVNSVTQDGATAIMYAHLNGHCEIVRLLLDREAEVNKFVKDVRTALILASQRGDCDMVRVLLEKGAEVNTAARDGTSALMYASQNGHCATVRLLLEREAEVNTVTQSGMTALMLASQKGHCDIVRLLLEGEAEINTVAHDSTTALMYACQNGHCDTVRLLLEREAEVNRVTQSGVTALMLASHNGHCDIVRLLLDGEAEINTVAHNGTTALMYACQNGHCGTVRLLLERKIEVNAVIQNGMTALMLASERGHCNIVRLLLGRESEVNTVAKDGASALMYASQNGHCDTVRLLLEREAEVNTVTQCGHTALMVASKGGHCDIVRLLLEREAELNTVSQYGTTALMYASQNGHCVTVRLLLEREAEVNTVTESGLTALMLASHNGHCDIVRLLLEREAEVTHFVNTALILAIQNGHWHIAAVLIEAGANVSHVNTYGETAAMYILFATTAKKCDRQLGEISKNACQNPESPKSHYGMSSASFALLGTLLYNTQGEWFDCHFAKSSLLEDIMYAYLPKRFHKETLFDKYLFPPYQGVEGKISLHTMATAIVCKLHHTALQWISVEHREKLVNMLSQTPLHLLAMENHTIYDMEDTILLLTETVGFSFSDRDNNGRVPYHIACMCLNAQLLQCGLRLDSDFITNMLVQDHLGKIPLDYMANLLCNAKEAGSDQSLKLVSARKTLEILMRSIGSDFAINMQRKTCTDSGLSNNIMDSLRKYFKVNMTIGEVSEITNRLEKNCFATDDVAWLFKCSSVGIVSLRDKQHAIVSVMNLLQVIGNEMGKTDPLFECVPELKGSVQENMKCGELDELDTSMKLVKFEDYFSIHILESGIKQIAEIAPQVCNRYWISGERDMFSSLEFCADFWQIFLKALGNEVIRSHIKHNGFIIENCKRKHGFVGMLTISCQLGDSIQLITVDIAPCIVSDNLDGYIALLRPRLYDNTEVGEGFYTALELSSSHKDWDFLKYLQPEVMCGYALVKMLRSLAHTFQTEQGKVYTVEEILPSYMVKTALLWILDPEDKCSKIYKDLEIKSVFDSESSSRYKADVLSLCETLLQDPGMSEMDIWDIWHMKTLLDICKKCTTGSGQLTVRERILPYVLATKRSDRQEQNGVNIHWILENWKPDTDIKDVSHQDEIFYSRKFYTDPEVVNVWIDHNIKRKHGGQFSYHKTAYPDISEEIARKCRVWALRILRILPLLLQYDGQINTSDGKRVLGIVGVKNYYLPDQGIYARDKNLAVALCQVLEAMLSQGAYYIK